MNLALNLLGLLLTAALVENPFYTRCFMAETVDAQLNERRDVMLRSIIAAGMCLPAAISGWLGRLIFTGYTDIPVYLSTPAGILLYIVIFLAGCGILFQATKNNRPTETFMHAITRDCFSFLPVGVLLLCCLNNYRWYECLVFGLGSGLGYLLAVRLHIVFADRLKYTRLPFFPARAAHSADRCGDDLDGAVRAAGAFAGGVKAMTVRSREG